MIILKMLLPLIVIYIGFMYYSELKHINKCEVDYDEAEFVIECNDNIESTSEYFICKKDNKTLKCWSE